ncbi:MAG: hypothetical protein ACK4WN_04380 [Aphanizomenon sp.]|jgi:hypothetical protein
MAKPVGGRGKKAGYETKLMRVPLPVVSAIEKIVDDFRDGSENETKQLSFDEALQAAKKIMKKKKSARQSLLNLLQDIYGREVDTLD